MEMLETVAEAIFKTYKLNLRGDAHTLDNVFECAQAAIDALNIIILPADALPEVGDYVLYKDEKNFEQVRLCRQWMIDLGGVTRIIERKGKPVIQETNNE